MAADSILINLATTSLTLGEVMSRIEEYRQSREFSGCEIFMDCDRYAIVARRR